ncbi:MAG: DUF917 domain-containing protein [Halobacteriota archaeon]
MTDTSLSQQIDDEWIRHAVTGGTFLGGGGGGSPDEGLEFARLAIEYGTPEIVPLEALEGDELVVTVSAVGAPAATDRLVKPADYVRAFELVCDHLESRGKTVAGMMTNEMGGSATVNGFVQSAVTGIPLVDATCNGRAHPTGPMGSIGLEGSDESVQSAVGGDPATGSHVELVIESTIDVAATAVRQAAQDAGGLVAVARNPVSAAYANENAAVGVYEQAVDLGRRIETAPDGKSAAEAVADALGGEVPAAGIVDDVTLETEGGFDVGTVEVDGASLTFWNEYMTLEIDGQRLATFPDLIALLDRDTGAPITTAALEAGRNVSVVTAPAASLSLGAGMRSPALFEPVEAAVGKSVIDYAFPSAVDDHEAK